MSYKNETYENIKDRILSNIDMNINKSEGSFLNNMVSPLSIELTKAYIEFEHILGLMFCETTYGKWLDMKVSEFGLSRKLGEVAKGQITFSGTVGTHVKLGTKVKTESNLIYSTTKDCIIGENSIVTIDIESVEVGKIYNVDVNMINTLVIDIPGVNSINNASAITDGLDRENDIELKERFFEKVRTPAISGNVANYKLWAKSIDGVGFVKVEPLWSGAGTVRVVVSDTENKPVTQTVIDEVSDYIETVRPVGASVTVITPTLLELVINVSVNIYDGYNIATIKENIEKNILNYIVDCKELIVFNKVAAIIGSEGGVVDYSNLTMNNTTTNIVLANNTVASLKALNIGEVVVIEE